MKPISGKRMCRVLEQQGWSLVRIKGSHHAYRKVGSTMTVVVPVHGNHDLKPGTQNGIMKDAGLSESDLDRCGSMAHEGEVNDDDKISSQSVKCGHVTQETDMVANFPDPEFFE